MVRRGVWIALFSQSGSELLSLSENLKCKPSIILTNNMNSSWVPGLNIYMQKPHNELMDWLMNSYPDHIFREHVLITLHGYLRILPKNICERYNIYNGHPAAIELYPELKGKDPQTRTWQDNEKYRIIGSVVHKVVPEVDAGEIVSSVCYTNRVESEQEMFTKLRQTSFEAWNLFLRRKLCELGLQGHSQ